MKKFKNKIIISTSLLLLLSMVGCGSSGVSSTTKQSAGAYDDTAYNGSSYNSGEVYESLAPEIEYEEDYAMDDVSTKSTSDTSSSSTSSENVSTNRKLIKTFNFNVETENIDEFISNLKYEINSVGGYIEDSNISGNSISTGNKSQKYASFTIRVPVGNLDDFATYVDNSANILSKSENVKDVTLDYTDMESRKKTLETERDRLLELLENASDLNDVILLEEKLSDVEYEIDRITSSLKTYDSLVEYSTINIEIKEVEKYTEIVEETPTLWKRMGDGFKNSLKWLKNFFEGLLVVIVALIPFIVLFGVLFAIGVGIVKLVLKNKQKNKGQVKKDNKQKIDDIPLTNRDTWRYPSPPMPKQQNVQQGNSMYKNGNNQNVNNTRNIQNPNVDIPKEPQMEIDENNEILPFNPDEDK